MTSLVIFGFLKNGQNCPQATSSDSLHASQLFLNIDQGYVTTVDVFGRISDLKANFDQKITSYSRVEEVVS